MGANVIKRNELPDDAADWTKVDVSFQRLDDDSEISCPASRNRIFEYVRIESADTNKAASDRLAFLRTARIGKTKYWLWNYTESDGEMTYVFFRQNPDGSTVLGLSGPNGLSPEQYLLADYYDEIYWS